MLFSWHLEGLTDPGRHDIVVRSAGKSDFVKTIQVGLGDVAVVSVAPLGVTP